MRTAPSIVLGLAAAIASASACAARQVPKPTGDGGSVVVLLPDVDGGPSGQVAVSNSSGTVQLDDPYESTRVAPTGPPSPAVKMDEAAVEREFGAVLAELPPAAQRFNLYFHTDSSELTEKSRALLPVVLQVVADRMVPDVTVIGHTDTTGTASSNFRLGLKRAMTMRGLLVSAGIDASLVAIESHGEGDLLTPTPDNTAEPTNRRVEITVK